MTRSQRRDAPAVRDWRDAVRMTQQAMAGGRETAAWRAVWIRRGGWHPGLLTAWSHLPDLEWAARVQFEPDGAHWIQYTGASLTPVPPPAGTPAAPARLTEAEIADCPETATWAPVWLGRNNAWQPALLTAWRRLPDRTWAGRLRWGPGDTESGWVRCTPDAVLPILPPDGTPAALTSRRP